MILAMLSSLAEEQLSSLREIKDNQEIAAYYEKISAENSEYLKWLAIFETARRESK